MSRHQSQGSRVSLLLYAMHNFN